MKKVIKKISIVVAIAAFAMLFKCSEAAPLGNKDDKIMAEKMTNSRIGDIILVSPNAKFEVANKDDITTTRLYLEDLKAIGIDAKSCKNANNEDIDNESALFTGYKIICEDGTTRTLVLCGDVDCGNPPSICTTDYDYIVDAFLQKGKYEMTDAMKMAANLYDDGDTLTILDIHRMTLKFFGKDDEIGDTLLRSWSNLIGMHIETENGTNEMEVDGSIKLKVTWRNLPDDANPTVVFQSEDDSIATVNEDGVVTGHSAGRTRIHATTTLTISGTQQQLHTSINVVVKEKIIHVEEITPRINPSQISVGGTSKINVTVTPPNATYANNVKYRSLNTSIATVDESGTVTGIAEGETKIQIYIDEEENMTPAEINIKVVKSTSIAEIDGAGPMNANASQQLTAYGEDGQQLTSDDVTWSSNKEDIATVDANGLVTTHNSTGSQTLVEITCTLKNGTGYRSVEFTVFAN